MAAADLLAQRSPAGRARPAFAALQGPATPGSPHTPLLSRSLSSQYGSPGSYRVEDEHVIYQIGSRCVRVGFAGEPCPKAVWQFCPDTGKRAGDYCKWTIARRSNDTQDQDIATDWELWDYDLVNLDIGLVEDKLERALRVLHGKHLLLDLKNRTAVVALPPCLPNPLVELSLKAIFTGVNSPKSAYLMSNPVLTAVAAGLRSALVVDIGWHETAVTAVYEYREVLQRRSIRSGKMLARETGEMLRELQQPSATTPPFSAIDTICKKLLWCRSRNQPTDLAAEGASNVQVDLGVPGGIKVPFSKLAVPTEKSFFEPLEKSHLTDDHDTSLPQLIWKALVDLPFDVRAICISRIVVTGGVSEVPGLKSRVIEEVGTLAESRGWDPVQSYGSAKRIPRRGLSQGTGPALGTGDSPSTLEENQDDANQFQGEEAVTNGSHTEEETDEITEKLERDASRSRPKVVKGKVRGVESLGPWAGASLMGHLKIEGSIEIKKDDFLKSGMNILGYPI